VRRVKRNKIRSAMSGFFIWAFRRGGRAIRYIFLFLKKNKKDAAPIPNANELFSWKRFVLQTHYLNKRQ
jgi:hypothetical protein